MADHNYSKRDGGERGRQLKLWREGGIKEKQGFLGIQKHRVVRCPSVLGGQKSEPQVLRILQARRGRQAEVATKMIEYQGW